APYRARAGAPGAAYRRVDRRDVASCGERQRDRALERNSVDGRRDRTLDHQAGAFRLDLAFANDRPGRSQATELRLDVGLEHDVRATQVVLDQLRPGRRTTDHDRSIGDLVAGDQRTLGMLHVDRSGAAAGDL